MPREVNAEVKLSGRRSWGSPTMSVEKALRKLKNKLKAEGITTRSIRSDRFFQKPSQKRNAQNSMMKNKRKKDKARNAHAKPSLI